jgi:hypothetical protein
MFAPEQMWQLISHGCRDGVNPSFFVRTPRSAGHSTANSDEPLIEVYGSTRR